MKSVPEVLLKKPRANWTAGDLWILRWAVTGGGLLLWIVLLCLLNLLSPWHPGHPALLHVLTLIYPFLLFALACRALPLLRKSKEINTAP